MVKAKLKEKSEYINWIEGVNLLRSFFTKEFIKVFITACLYSLCICLPVALLVLHQSIWKNLLLFVLFFVAALVVIHTFPKKRFERRHLNILYAGNYALKVFTVSCTFMIIIAVLFFLEADVSWQTTLFSTVWLILLETLLFWNGMLRVYISSVQLGIKMRILAGLCGWLPIINIYMLFKTIQIVENELDFEYEKDLLDNVEVESVQCNTRYPLVFVHGVFFRDIKYLNYWGRIPRFLKQRGAVIHYGGQESAQSVEYCGNQLAIQIEKIVEETGCEKVNIIAHSKGGLDSRYAISQCEIAPYVASLTTINTPHNGCIFANYLLEKAPKKLVSRVEKIYNGSFQKLGDKNPDFLEAVKNLSDEACQKLNVQMPNVEGVYCRSVASHVKKATSGKFPLNLSYPIVKHFDGKNDGLVSVESASFFEENILVQPTGKRGISHADMIDLNRENIDGFDVRNFYQKLIVELKQQGL